MFSNPLYRCYYIVTDVMYLSVPTLSKASFWSLTDLPFLTFVLGNYCDATYCTDFFEDSLCSSWKTRFDFNSCQCTVAAP